MDQNFSRQQKKLILSSITYLLLSLLVFMVSVYAWFTITNVNYTSLVSNVSGVEAEYEFYIFIDSYNNGSSDLRLYENLYEPGKTDRYYELIPNPTVMYIVDGLMAPGDRISFALKIRSVGVSSGYVDLDLGQVLSFGYPNEENKIQIAFRYETRKISTVLNGMESEDIKDELPIIYENAHFTSNSNNTYLLVHNTPLLHNPYGISETIIYFDFYFDPEIKGFDPFGDPYENSNIFMNQTLEIRKIYMIIHG